MLGVDDGRLGPSGSIRIPCLPALRSELRTLRARIPSIVTQISAIFDLKAPFRSVLINHGGRNERNASVHLALRVGGQLDRTDATAHTQEGDPAEVGQLSPLIPLPKDAIHMGWSWTPHSKPKICFGMRPSEYIGHHLVAKDGQLKEVFQQLVYGDYGFSTGPHGLDQSVANGEIERENFVCWDLTHPDAFKDTGQFSILDANGKALITKADIALTKDAISAGDSKGLHYNIFCGGNVALADGRWASAATTRAATTASASSTSSIR